MVSVFIDQLVSAYFRVDYDEFSSLFRFPKLHAHIGTHRIKPGWLVYSGHGYDKKIEWDTTQNIALTLFSDCLKFLAARTCEPDIAGHVLILAEEKSRIDFEAPSAQRFIEILSFVGENFEDGGAFNA